MNQRKILKNVLLCFLLLLAINDLLAQRNAIEQDGYKALNGDSTCFNLTLTSPSNGEVFRINRRERPRFEWKIEGRKKLSYTFTLIELGKNQPNSLPRVIYETTTRNQYLDWPESVEWPKDIPANNSLEYMWSVQIIVNTAKDCENIAKSMFAVGSPGIDLDRDSLVIVCKNPPYDSIGNVCYEVTEYWTVDNSYSTPATFNTHIVESNANGITWNLGSPSYIINIPTTVPIGIQPISFSYEVCLPLGEIELRSKLEYTSNTNPASGTLTDTLPLCICDICEEWEININNISTEPWVNRSAGQDYLYIEDDILVTAPTGPIVRVEAEIIQYEHWGEWGVVPDSVNNQCFTCNTKNGQHGTFVPYYDASSTALTNLMSTGFINSDRAYYRQSSLGPPPSRNIVWRTASPAGVAMPIRSKLSIGVPNFSQEHLLDCCEDLFKICIRYTFTSYHSKLGCRVCSEVICYEIKRNSGTIQIKTTPQSTY